MFLAKTVFADPIHDAAMSGDLAGVQAELDKGVDVNAKASIDYTPLHYAAGGGRKEIVDLLISEGADVNAKNTTNQTPLHKASYKGYKEIVVVLLGNGADVNAKNDNGETPLELADGEIVDLLLQYGGMTGAELNTILPLLTAELTFTAVSEFPKVYAMARGSGICNGADISGSFVILYGSKFNLRIVKESDHTSIFKGDTQLGGNLNGVMTVALPVDLFSASFSTAEALVAVPYTDGKWDTGKAVPVAQYRNLSFDAANKAKSGQWKSVE